MATARIDKWDNAKIFLITLVVCGHLCDYYTSASSAVTSVFIFIYSFHMPLFILIVGLFAKRACNADRFPVGKVFGYLMLALVCQLVCEAGRWICWRQVNFTIVNQDALSWFLIACAVYIALSWCLRNVKFGYLFAFALLLGIFCGYDSQIGDDFALSRIIVYYPFFLVGLRLDPTTFADKTSTVPAKVAGAVVLIGFALICAYNIGDVAALRPLFTGRNPFSATPGFGAPERVLTYIISGVMCLAFCCIMPKRRLGYLTSAGTRTLQVYILHVAVIFLLVRAGVPGLLQAASPSGWLAIWVLLCIPIAALLSIPVLEKPFRKLLDSMKTVEGKAGRK